VTEYALTLAAAGSSFMLGLIDPKGQIPCDSLKAWRRMVTATLKAKA